MDTFPDVYVVGEAVSGKDAVRQASRFHPAVALIDIHLPTMSGIEATRLTKVLCPSIAIIGLTTGEPDDTDMAIISAGY